MNIKDIEEVSKLLNDRKRVLRTIESLIKAKESISKNDFAGLPSIKFNSGHVVEIDPVRVLPSVTEAVLITFETELQDIENALTLTFGIELED